MYTSHDNVHSPLGDPVGLPNDPTDLSNFCGSSKCTGSETGQDAMICGQCFCPSYNGTYSPAAKPHRCAPCLFNVRADPSERVNLAASNASVDVARLAEMTARLLELKKTCYTPQYPGNNVSDAPILRA
jgi:hypothetical protein